MKIWSERSKQNSIALIKNDDYKHLNEATIRRHIKHFLIDRDGHVCAICQSKEWMGQPIPLVCDHIDGDIQNNDITNFRNVCCNCDAQLPTFKSKNKRGKGRQYNRDYMRANKRI